MYYLLIHFDILQSTLLLTIFRETSATLSSCPSKT